MTLEELLYNKEFWYKSIHRMENKELPNKEEELNQLYRLVETSEFNEVIEQLLNGTYKWSIPHKVEIAKVGTTKKRVVYMYTVKERVIQGALYRALSHYYNDQLSQNCFAYRQGVTTQSAVLYIKKHKQEKEMYGLKMDISSYFNSVSEEHLKNTLKEMWSTKEVPKGLQKTIEKVMLDKRVQKGKEIITEYKSLIAGSPLGSFFANYCLKDIDAYFDKKEDIIYARYSDDIILMHESKEVIQEYTEQIKEMIKGYGLTINPSKYTNFEPNEEVEYLGLELSPHGIDISKHSRSKVKRQIKRWVKKERVKIEREGKSFEKSAINIMKRLNTKFYRSYIIDPSKYGWGYYAFRFITTDKSLRELDYYLKDQLRYLKTGKHNKHNWVALSDEDFERLGFVSLVQMYHLFKTDFDYYCEVAYLLK